MRLLLFYSPKPRSQVRILIYRNWPIQASFYFRKCQEPVRYETTEGFAIEFIGYRMPYQVTLTDNRAEIG